MNGPKLGAPVELPPGAWRAVLVLALAFEWEPRFPLSEQLGYADLTVAGDDASELADALERALPDVPPQRIAGPPPTTEWPSLAGALVRLAGLQDELRRVIDNARAGWVRSVATT